MAVVCLILRNPVIELVKKYRSVNANLYGSGNMEVMLPAHSGFFGSQLYSNNSPVIASTSTPSSDSTVSPISNSQRWPL